MPISPHLRDDCQLIFSVIMFVCVFLTANHLHVHVRQFV